MGRKIQVEVPIEVGLSMVIDEDDLELGGLPCEDKDILQEAIESELVTLAVGDVYWTDEGTISCEQGASLFWTGDANWDKARAHFKED